MMDSMPGYALDAFRKEGAVTCIHKPFNIKEVRSVVDEIIKKEKT
jgi:DNA-binding response OmpR family regulator